MTDPTQTAVHAKHRETILAAIAGLNAAINAAYEDGLVVSIDEYRIGGLRKPEFRVEQVCMPDDWKPDV